MDNYNALKLKFRHNGWNSRLTFRSRYTSFTSIQSALGDNNIEKAWRWTPARKTIDFNPYSKRRLLNGKLMPRRLTVSIPYGIFAQAYGVDIPAAPREYMVEE